MRTLKVIVVVLFTGLTFAALGSIGGGSKAKTNSLINSEFAPIRNSRGFSLRSGLRYSGSLMLKQEKSASFINYNTLVTYERGNTTFILPTKYKLSLTSSDVKNNLQLLNLKIRLNK